ncbi:hypothetical protein [Pseudomonas fluorescens]|uniref:hypothetical protein n=1 Tax=Pseudomonas fluorescens TaxID=294 RepID=UPI001240B412|nr:hypothetical protein [Pseudomonas fluorescens]
MLEPSIRQIAIQAIASQVSGTPAEAAIQILEGIAVIDFPGKPFVIWPAGLPPAEQIVALELELKRIRHANQSAADYWAMRESHPRVDSGARLEHQDTQSRPEASGTPAAEVEDQSTPDEATEEAALHPAQKPAQGASDASQ